MADLLIWSERALTEFDKLQAYLQGEWGDEITQRVITEITQTIQRIQISSQHFPYYKEREKYEDVLHLPKRLSFLGQQKILWKSFRYLITGRIQKN